MTVAGTNGAARAAVEAKRIAVDIERSITAHADHDQPNGDGPDDAGESPPLKYRGPDLAALIRERASRPWISLRVGADRAEVVRARAGQVVVVTAATGAGKSSLAIEWGWRHAHDIGPAVYVSCELDADEIGARIVGQRCDASWADALTDRVRHADQERAVALPRLVVLDGDDATLDRAASVLARLAVEYPDQPALVVIDYLSILPLAGAGHGDERIRISMVAESVRRWAKIAAAVGAVVVAVSQTSRAAATGLRAGKLIGRDTASTGAESAQIERMAAVTVAIGEARGREDGTEDVSISIGKGRMGQGDRVIPAVYDGRTGSWRVDGPAVSGDQHRARLAGASDVTAVRTARAAVVAFMAGSDAPMSRKAIREAVGLKREPVYAAIAELVASGELVEVARGKAGGYWPLWTRARAEDAGAPIVPSGAGHA